MESSEIQKLAELEDEHWWYRERRHLLAQAVTGLTPGVALDVGAAGGGNTRVLQRLGWRAAALEFTEVGARLSAGRGVATLRADATALPVADHSLDLAVAFDILEHIEDDVAAAAHLRRALRPGGVLLVAVPADPRLWSAHDEAVGHVRRYTRPGLCRTLSRAGLRVQSARSWNVLMRPALAVRRRSSSGSDLAELPAWLNRALGAVIAAERVLPVGALPGVSLLARAVPA